MILFIARFISLLFLALASGVVFSHVVQARHKTTLPGPVYLTVQTVLYRDYGKLGGILEAGAFLASLVTLIFIWGRPAPLGLTLLAALCVAAMTVVWGVFINPINQQVLHWTPESLPSHWTKLRDRWATLHATRFVLAAIGLSALILSVLIG